jgi:hypothetical protein
LIAGSFFGEINTKVGMHSGRVRRKTVFLIIKEADLEEFIFQHEDADRKHEAQLPQRRINRESRA